MWTVILAILQAIPFVARIIGWIIPSRRERQAGKIHSEKRHEREKIERWVDRGGSYRL